MNVDTSFLLVTYNNVLKAKTNIAAILVIKLKDITLVFLVFLSGSLSFSFENSRSSLKLDFNLASFKSFVKSVRNEKSSEILKAISSSEVSSLSNHFFIKYSF